MESNQVVCNLKDIMDDREMNISQVAREVGITNNTVRSYYKNQMVRIDIEVAKKLCDFLQINFGELFTYNPLSQSQSDE